MTVSTVPALAPGQGTIAMPRVDNPWLSVWWTAQTVSGVPENVMGWLVAQGWEITNVASDTSTTPSTAYYALQKQGMQPWQVLLSLCNSFTTAANEARWANEFRYNQVVSNWTDMISSTQTQFDAQTAAQNSQLGIYISDLNKYTDEIDALIEENRDKLILDYAIHASTAEGLLTDLGTAELTRINEEFTASLSVELQMLIDNGLYTSLLAAERKSANTVKRDEQVQAHKERLAREKLDNEHKLYGQKVDLAEFRHKAVTAKMNAYVARLEGWKTVHADNQRLMAYQLDERNKLLIGLYSFVERREDKGPDWKDMSSMISGLGDAAGGWIQP